MGSARAASRTVTRRFIPETPFWFGNDKIYRTHRTALLAISRLTRVAFSRPKNVLARHFQQFPVIIWAGHTPGQGIPPLQRRNRGIPAESPGKNRPRVPVPAGADRDRVGRRSSAGSESPTGARPGRLSLVLALAVANGEGDLRVDPESADLVVLHDRLEVLDVDRLDIVDGLRRLRDGEPGGVLPALLRLRQDLDHLHNRHGPLLSMLTVTEEATSGTASWFRRARPALPFRRIRVRRGCALQERDHLPILQLMEVPIVDAEGAEVLRRRDRDHVVGLRPEPRRRIGRSDGRCEHQPRHA